MACSSLGYINTVHSFMNATSTGHGRLVYTNIQIISPTVRLFGMLFVALIATVTFVTALKYIFQMYNSVLS